ncbi:putative bifunctional diguanylate cyclase/phosphodiesterase [Gallaecimonas pentaromativorans]|uniref:putative bifunctional diguanylate cyclase/phosphodiesterase n=1 Tax=Gallaecimonas pentaromativorans TaxID=584787 RepID=UPI003A938C65
MSGLTPHRLLPVALLLFLWTLLGSTGYWVIEQSRAHQRQQTHILALQIRERLKTFATERQAAIKQLASVWPETHPNTENWFAQEAGNLQNMLPGLGYLAWVDGSGALRIARQEKVPQGCQWLWGSEPINARLGAIRYGIALCQVLPTIIDSALATGFAAAVRLDEQAVYALGHPGEVTIREPFVWFNKNLQLELSPIAGLNGHLYLMLGCAMVVALMLSVLMHFSLKRAWALNRSRGIFQAASKASVDGLLVFTPDGGEWHLAEYNDSAVRLVSPAPDMTLSAFCEALAAPSLTGQLAALDIGDSIITSLEPVAGRSLHLQGVRAKSNLAITVRDITQLKLAEADLAAREAKYRRLIEGLRGHLVFSLDERGEPEFLSKGAAELFGNEDIGEVFSQLRGQQRWREAKQRLNSGEDSVRVQLPLRIKEVVRHIEVVLSKVEFGFEGLLRDVTDEAELMRRIRHQASHDALTGLANRYAFDKALTKAWQQGTACQALLLMDLDQFKLVNDRFGHEKGDQLLLGVAERLSSALAPQAFIARLGGDEFAVVLSGEDLPGQGQQLLDALRQAPVAAGEHQFPITASMGLVPFGAASDTADLKRIADMAAYAAKEAGGDRLQCYRDGDGWLKAREETMVWAEKVRSAISEHRLALAVQSIARTEQPTKVVHREVLVRLWDNGELIPAWRFIPAAERYGLMVALDKAVIAKGLAWLATRPAERLAFNLSGASLSDQGFCQWLLATLKEGQLAPERLCFEVTETAVIEHLGHATELMDALRALGCTLSLDDFGSGMSSLSYLKALPVDHIKIDGAFIREIKNTHFDRVAVRTIASLARALGKVTIAEYVTDQATLTLLKRLGVDMVQGYAIDQPTLLEELQSLPATMA